MSHDCGCRCGCGCEGKGSACVHCGTPALERLNYYDGQFMVARDFSDEQAFLLGKHREHNHSLHGWGTVCGLKVTPHPDPACRDRYIVIEPGVGLDCCGREIHVTEKCFVDVRAELSLAPDPPEADAKTLLISICYHECRTEYSQVLYSDCACEQERCEPARIRETFKVKLALAKSVPMPKPRDPSTVSLTRSNTLNFDNAMRIAVDPKLGRIYLLNGKTPAQVAVYESSTFCLLGAVDLGGPGLDIAVSPDGATLYVVTHVAGPDAFKLRAFDVKILSAVTQIGADLDAGAGALDPDKPPQVAVSGARVFVLNAVANKVFIFDTTPSLASFGMFDKTEEFRSIAVTADGTWLFVAAPGHVWAVKVAAMTSTSITVADDPVQLSVSGDGLRLFVGTKARTVHMFTIQETPVPFPEVGAGVSVVDDIVSISASPTGSTLYELGNAAGSAVIRSVDADRIEKSPSTAVSNPVAAGNAPQEILLDPDGNSLYAVVSGSATGACSGAAVFNVTERDCKEIVWEALAGCPDCDDGSCILLAAVADYAVGQSIEDIRIDNRVRPMVPSTTTLLELIECCCGAAGKQGPKGDPGTDGKDGIKGKDGTNGKDGKDGTNGKDGINGKDGVNGKDGTNGKDGVDGKDGVCDCCEDDLTRIQALSWSHDKGVPFAQVTDPATGVKLPAIVVRFGPKKVVIPDTVAGPRIFRVEMIDTPQSVDNKVFRCFCELQGTVVGVENIVVSAGLIKTAVVTAAPAASGLAFLLDARFNNLINTAKAEVRVTILGDFVMEDGTKRAIDAEFPRAELPTGDHPSGAKGGIQGGTFHSWFWVKERPTA